MQSKGNAPSAAQVRWRETVRNVGCIATGDQFLEPVDTGMIEAHHCLGASAVRNKVPIGHWYVLPLHWRLHNISSSWFGNITTNKKSFIGTYGTEKSLFMKMIYGFLMAGIEIPFNNDVLNAIAKEDTI